MWGVRKSMLWFNNYLHIHSFLASADVINCLMNDFARDKQPSKKHKRMVRRPVILISSNFFAASLRKLRPACFAVHITALNKTRTIARLEKVTNFLVPMVKSISLCFRFVWSRIWTSSVTYWLNCLTNAIKICACVSTICNFCVQFGGKKLHFR